MEWRGRREVNGGGKGSVEWKGREVGEGRGGDESSWQLEEEVFTAGGMVLTSENNTK